MELTNKIQILSKYKRKTKKPFWTNLEKDDIMKIVLELKNETGASNGMYSPKIKCICNGEEFIGGYHEVQRYLSNIDYV